MSGRSSRPPSVLSELLSDPPAALGLLIVLLVVGAAVAAPWIAPFDPAEQSMLGRLKPPAWVEGGLPGHLFGTDALGRDVLSRVIWGARVTLVIAAVTSVLAAALGTVVGLWAGFAGGRADTVLMRLVEIQVTFPGILLILLVVSVLGAGATTLILVLAATNWMVYGRLVRSIVLTTRQLPYVEAAEVVGCRPARVVFRHILPNLVPPLLTLLILEFTNIILAEAAVSFLGFGVQPPATSWGLDVAAARDYLFIAWWLVTFPGLAIVLTVLSINLFANWLRETTDPEARERRFARRRSVRRRPAEPARAPAE